MLLGNAMSAEEESVPVMDGSKKSSEQPVTNVEKNSISSSALTAPPEENFSLASSPTSKSLPQASNLCCVLNPYRVCKECKAPACSDCYITNKEIKNCVTRDNYHPRFNSPGGTDPHARTHSDC